MNTQQQVKKNTLFKLNNFTYYYPHGSQPALNNVNLEIEAGEFLLVMGRSGSGKSTLARVLCGLVPDFYGGSIKGEVFYQGIPLAKWEKNRIPQEIGIVFQEPDSQLIFRNVERDIAFGLENLGMDIHMMQRRVAETIDFLNLNNLKNRERSSLSGGEKQKIALAGVLAMNPRVLILDEPTSQLDPVAAGEFLSLLKDLNQDFGTTIILIEQRLDKAFSLADRVVIMEDGSNAFSGDSREQLLWAAKYNYPLVPVISAIFSGFTQGKIPLSVKEGKYLLNDLENESSNKETKCKLSLQKGKPVVEINHLSFSYPAGETALNNLNLKIWPGECVALIGANGAGKSTLLQIIAGLLEGYKGSIRVAECSGKELKAEKLGHWVAYLPQNLDDFFLEDTVAEDIRLANKEPEKVEKWLKQMKLLAYRDHNPRKLSIGEKHRAALAAVLASEPVLLLLDEPTTGMDSEQKQSLGELLIKLCRQQKSVLLITHDIDFASEYAGRILFMHNGRILEDGPVEELMKGNVFYASQVARLFRDTDSSIVNKAGAIKYLTKSISASIAKKSTTSIVQIPPAEG
jgi:energy-coupling factor transporter ATP-binding protein EcfA2